MVDHTVPPTKPSSTGWRQVLARQDVLAGLLFMAVAALGLWLSRDYPIGSALRMGTGYVPRLICWVLLVLGAIVLLQGLRTAGAGPRLPRLRLRPLLLIPLSLVAFALAIERWGIVAAGILLILIGGLASSTSRPLEVVVSAAVLVFCTWAIFVWALGLPIPVWPGG